MRTAPLLILIAVVDALVSMGCAHRVDLYTASESRAPALVGKTVAVLPPLAVGTGQGTAILGDRVLAEIFPSELAGVRFLPPQKSVAALSGIDGRSPADLKAILAARLPLKTRETGRKTRLFKDRTLGKTRLPRKLIVTLQRNRQPSIPRAPSQVPSDLFSAIEADYVLVSTSFPAYRQVTQITALAGILPVFWSQDLGSVHPRCLFALYETKSGTRVWETIVAVTGHTWTYGKPYSLELVDPRVMPFVGAAYLLTGNVEIPLARAVEVLGNP